MRKESVSEIDGVEGSEVGHSGTEEDRDESVEVVIGDLGDVADSWNRKFVVGWPAGFLDGLSGFADHGVACELHAEHLVREVSEVHESVGLGAESR